MDNLSLFFLVFGFSNKSQLLDILMLIGARLVIILAFLLIFYLAFKGSLKDRKAFIFILISIPIAIILIKIIHLFYVEPRPFITHGFTPLYPYNPDASFPSRHTSFMSIIAFSYAYFKSKWTPLFLFLLIWVGISRIYTGVHYPLDIIGGIFTGIISILVAKQILKLLKIRFGLN